MKKKIIAFATVLALILQPVILPESHVQAAEGTCTVYNGSNAGTQNYSRWASPISSYLVPCTDGNLMRVQGDALENDILVEYYDSAYNLKSTKTIAGELPLFGGFYASDTNYYLLTGQQNSAESADVEVYRITKYDKNWNRLGSAGLYDCNTTIPFDAGSARMDMYGKYLFVRTCHEMYASDDGYNHQANVTIQIDTETMTITDSYTDIMNVNYGYVSHSFNQFIKVENGKLVTLDHGDAHPRSLVLLKYQTDVTTGKFVPSYYTGCEQINVLEFPGATGNNSTGASAGGFEISGSHYLAAGNSVVQDDTNLTQKTRNVFVAAVDKSTSQVQINWITSYAEGESTASTPQFVKINDNRYILLWTKDGSVYYTEIDGSGKSSGTIYSLKGNLSDCVPVISENKLIWYTWDDKVNTFYDIHLNDLSQSSSTVIENGHQYENLGVADGYANLLCTRCRENKQEKVITSMMVLWRIPGTNSYGPSLDTAKSVGDVVNYWIYETTPSDANSEIEIISSDPERIEVNAASEALIIKKPGTASVTISPKYNPDYALTYTFHIPCGDNHEWETKATADKEPTCTEAGNQSVHCKNCTEIKDIAEIPALGHDWSNTLSHDGEKHWYACGRCDTRKDEATHSSNTTPCMQKPVCDICGITYGNVKQHDWDAQPTVDKEPTCTETGSQSVHCKNCTEIKDVTEIPTLEHNWSETISHDAEKHWYTCSWCGERKEEPHSCKETNCAELPICDICGISYGEIKEHSWDTQSTVDKEPTCTEAGSQSVHCKNCTKTKDITEIPALGHDWSNTFSHDTEKHWYACGRCDTRKDEATHSGGTATESEKAICDVCGASYGELLTPDIPAERRFVDVLEGDWFEPYVNYVADRNIMTGLRDKYFGPSENIVRAQFAVILHRMEGTPAIAYTDRFPDVQDEIWYTDAILWAASTGVVTGYTATNCFGPSDNINREQMAVMMYRYAKYKKYDLSDTADYSSYEDAANVQEYAKEAMSWAVGAKIITGKTKPGENTPTMLDPQGYAIRAECAAIIQRFLEKYN